MVSWRRRTLSSVPWYFVFLTVDFIATVHPPRADAPLYLLRQQLLSDTSRPGLVPGPRFADSNAQESDFLVHTTRFACDRCPCRRGRLPPESRRREAPARRSGKS